MRSYGLTTFTLLLLIGIVVVSADNLLRTSSSLRGPNHHDRKLEKSPVAEEDDEDDFHSQAAKAEQSNAARTTGEVINPNDTGHRFEKFSMYDNKEKPNMQSTSAYPMSTEVSTLLRFHSNGYSIMTDEDYRMKGHDIEHYIEAVGGYPPRPSKDLNDKYWEEFRVVCQMQLLRRNEQLPDDQSIWRAPDLWKEFSAYEVAEAVHDEYPGLNQANLIEWFIINTGIKLDYDILPFRCRDDFIGTNVRLAALNTWAITTVAPINFAAKWHVGQIRPEEMAYKIATGEIPKEEVPPDIYQMIIDMELTDAPSFTQYPEGCPLHPSWPAMHSAASSLSLWLPVVAKLTDEQYCQVLLTDYAVSFARTVAGVHYKADNYAGLNMGQEVISKALPDHLEKVYGADPDAVKAKIEKYRFDWRNFSPKDCAPTLVQPLPTIPKPTTPASTVEPTTPGTTVADSTTALTTVAPGPRKGCTLKTVDFNDQPRGKYITNEYAAYGLTLSASGGEGTAPRIFDTHNPGDEVNGDSDLGSPNVSCGGPGTGEGGKKGKFGENCTPLGNVLIVQEPNNPDMSIPDDHVDGGEVIMKFQGQYVKEIGLLDVDYKTRLIVEFNHSSGVARRTMNIPQLGDNSYQIIDIDIEGVRSMKLELTRSGSISFVSFCPI